MRFGGKSPGSQVYKEMKEREKKKIMQIYEIGLN